MDPNIYFTYLCLLDYQGPVPLPVQKAFKEWRAQPNSFSPYYVAYGQLEHEIQMICWRKETQYKVMYIYEAEKAWSDFNITKFMAFLEGLGFKK